MKTSPLICSANQWTSCYMIAISVVKQLICNGNGDNDFDKLCSIEFFVDVIPLLFFHGLDKKAGLEIYGINSHLQLLL